MDSIVPAELDKYCEKHTEPEGELLAALAKETVESQELPQMLTGHLEGAFLRMMLRLIKAKYVVEIGTYTGYSALAMAEALPEDGELVTCDVDHAPTALAQKYWKQSPHGHKITLKLGEAMDSLDGLYGPFDAAFIDADKENYIHYWEHLLPMMRSGGLIMADNVLWDGKVLDPKEPSDHAIVAFNDHVKKDKRVEAVMVPIRDGVTLAWVR